MFGIKSLFLTNGKPLGFGQIDLSRLKILPLFFTLLLFHLQLFDYVQDCSRLQNQMERIEWLNGHILDSGSRNRLL